MQQEVCVAQWVEALRLYATLPVRLWFKSSRVTYRFSFLSGDLKKNAMLPCYCTGYGNAARTSNLSVKKVSYEENYLLGFGFEP